MGTFPKAKISKAFWSSMALATALTAVGQLAVDTNSPTTNFGGSRPAGSGIKPSVPDQGGTAWMADTNKSSDSNNANAVGGTGQETPGRTGQVVSGNLNNLGWVGLLGLGGLFGLLRRHFEQQRA